MVVTPPTPPFTPRQIGLALRPLLSWANLGEKRTRPCSALQGHVLVCVFLICAPLSVFESMYPANALKRIAAPSPLPPPLPTYTHFLSAPAAALLLRPRNP